jgi:uncharacterized protein
MISAVRWCVLQPTPFCNLDCSYCYLPNRKSTRSMTPDVLEQSFKFLFRDAQLIASRLNILWHAGEPLTVPRSFYEQAFSLQRAYSRSSVDIQHCITTNATLIDTSWCDLFKTNAVDVSVSIDGPEEIHDRHRRTRFGKGTFAQVMRGIHCLKQHAVPFNVVAVLSEDALRMPEELWNFFANIGAESVHFLLEEIQGVHLERTLDTNRLLPRLEKFLERVQSCRTAIQSTVHLREIDRIAAGIEGWAGPVCDLEQVPLGIVNIASDGSVSTFGPELLGMNTPYGHFVFGNVASHRLRDVLNHQVFDAAYADMCKGIERCRQTCPYFAVCGGGNSAAKLAENGSFDSTETPACQFRIKAATNVALRTLERQRGISNENGNIAERIARLNPRLKAASAERCVSVD